MKFKNLPDEEKPRERLYLYGAQNLSNDDFIKNRNEEAICERFIFCAFN